MGAWARVGGAVAEKEGIRQIVTYGRRMLFVRIPAFMGARAAQFLVGVLAAPTTIEQLAFPYFAKLGWRKREVRALGVGLAFTAALGCVGLLLTAQPLVPWVYGAPYVHTLDSLSWLLGAGAGALRVGAVFMGSSAKASGQLRTLATSPAASLAVTILCLVTLMPWLGAIRMAPPVPASQTAYGVCVTWWLSVDGLLDLRVGAANG